MAEPLIIGRPQTPAIQVYFNNLKFFSSCLAFPASPGVLSDLILRGKVLAGPVAALDFIRLSEAGCTSLSDFGLFVNPYIAYDAAREAAGSAALICAPLVMLMKKPIEEHSFLRVGISEEIMNMEREALLLTKLLLSFYWEVDHEISFELSLDDDAWVCQGGPYLALRSKQFFGFPYAYDLAWEWYRWKKAPYIFYRWLCGPDVDAETRDQLIAVIRRTLELNLRNLSQLAHYEASLKGLERGELLTYLGGFGHRLGLWQKSSEYTLGQLTNLLHESEISAFR